MKKYLYMLDILNQKPTFYISSKTRYSSTLGLVLSIFTIISILSISMYFFLEFIQKNQINVLVNNLNNIYPIYNITDLPLMFSLQTINGEVLKNDTINFSPQLFTFLPENKGKPLIKFLPFEKCDVNKNFGDGEYRDLYKDFANLEGYYCLVPGRVNTTIFGSLGDLVKGYSYLNLYINRCQNNSMYNHKNVSCDTREKIDSILNGVAIYLRISFIDRALNHTNYNQPVYSYVKNEAYQLSTSFYPRFFFNFKNFLYNSDIGFFTKEIIQQTGFKYDSISQINSMKSPFIVPEAFSLFSITLSQSCEEYNRSYQKIQQLIANLGGIVNSLIFIIQNFLFFFSNKLMMLDFANKIIACPETEREKNNFTEKKITTAFKRINNSENSFKNFPRKKNVLENSIHIINNINSIKYNSTIKNFQIIKSNDNVNNLGINKFKKFQKNQFSLSFNEMFNLMVCYNSKNKFYNWGQISSFIKHSLSQENILKNLTEYQVLKSIIFKENQLFIFNNLPKLRIEEHLKNLETKNLSDPQDINSNLRSLDLNDIIDNKLMKFFIEFIE